VVGASGTVTSQNIAAIGKAAEGFVTGVGYSPQIDSTREQEIRRRPSAPPTRPPRPLRRGQLRRAVLLQGRGREGRSDRDRQVREAMRGLTWQTPQGAKTMRAGDHQAMQDMYAVRVKGGDFEIVGKVAGAQAVGADTCTRF
jgi:hypothetical protein